MLTTAKFKEEFRCFKKGSKFEFRPGVNLLVGDQGTGKSSLLGLVRGMVERSEFDRKHAKKTLDLKTSGAVQILCYDFEKDNPRVSAGFSDNLPMDWQLQARWMSHGQVVNAIHANLTGLARKKEPYALIMDEPDTGLSPRSAHELVRHMVKLAKRHQILAAVHNPILIASQPEVLSLEHRRWMSSEEFLEEMKKPRPEEAT